MARFYEDYGLVMGGGVNTDENWYTRRSVGSEELSGGFDELYNDRGTYIEITQNAKLTINKSGMSQTGNITNIFDFDGDTFYMVTGGGPLYLTFDMHIKREVKSYLLGMQVSQGGGEANYTVSLQSSNDGITWTNVNTTTANLGSSQNLSFDFTGGDLNTRFIRIYFIRNSSTGGGFNFYVYSFHIYI